MFWPCGLWRLAACMEALSLCFSFSMDAAFLIEHASSDSPTDCDALCDSKTMLDLKCLMFWVRTCFVREKIHSASLFELKDSHNSFSWEALNVNITFVERKLHRAPLRPAQERESHVLSRGQHSITHFNSLLTFTWLTVWSCLHSVRRRQKWTLERSSTCFYQLCNLYAGSPERPWLSRGFCVCHLCLSHKNKILEREILMVQWQA